MRHGSTRGGSWRHAIWIAWIASVAAVAADWEPVGTDADGNRYSVDASRIVRDAGIASVLVRAEYAKPRRVDAVEQAVFASLDRMVIDCGHATFAIESRSFVAADGTEIPRGATPRAELRYRAAAAGSMSETIVRHVCKGASGTRPND